MKAIAGGPIKMLVTEKFFSSSTNFGPDLNFLVRTGMMDPADGPEGGRACSASILHTDRFFN